MLRSPRPLSTQPWLGQCVCLVYLNNRGEVDGYRVLDTILMVGIFFGSRLCVQVQTLLLADTSGVQVWRKQRIWECPRGTFPDAQDTDRWGLLKPLEQICKRLHRRAALAHAATPASSPDASLTFLHIAARRASAASAVIRWRGLCVHWMGTLNHTPTIRTGRAVIWVQDSVR